jgi:hypothetical protein
MPIDWYIVEANIGRQSVLAAKHRRATDIPG